MSKITNLNSIVNNLVDAAFVPDSRDAGVRASNLSQETKQQEKWTVTPIITYVRHTESADSIFSAIDALVEKQDEHMANGGNLVYLEGATLWHNNKDGREFLKLVLKNAKTGIVEENIALFPGNEYTDKYGVINPAGHNWLAFAEEVKSQYNKQGLSYSSKGGFVQLLRSMQTYSFETWLLYDGKYTNMYVTEQKYQFALDRLARERKKGNPVKKTNKPAPEKVEDNQPPFDLDEK